MISCKDVATLLASERLDGASRWLRLQVGLHLLMCRYCRAFERQLACLRAAGRSMRNELNLEPGTAGGLESRLLRDLGLDELGNH